VDIHNEIKIITARDELYSLWSRVILSVVSGDLIDPEKLQKFKLNPRWTSDKGGQMSREFFKWLGNLSEDDLKRLASHLLKLENPKWTVPYPKVTMKKLTQVVPECVSVKDRLERCKRKQAVRKQLNLLKPSLGLYSSEGNFKKAKWKAFKKEYHVTPASLNALLTVPGDEFFTLDKFPSSKNKSIHELSPHAEEFFKVFLQSKGKYVQPRGTAYYRPYDPEEDKLTSWAAGTWTEDRRRDVKLGIMDLRDIPGKHE
jgi:hypothetical protein